MTTLHPLVPGAPAPDFALESDSGKTIRLADLRGQRVILYFYPKDLTPGCTAEACDFQAALPQLGKVTVIGVSRDPIELHQEFKKAHHLTFPLLSDPTGETMTAYGAWGEKMNYGKKVLGVIRTTVVIAPDGTIEQLFANVKATGHVARLLKAL